jgi:hypothetical protein
MTNTIATSGDSTATGTNGRHINDTVIGWGDEWAASEWEQHHTGSVRPAWVGQAEAEKQLQEAIEREQHERDVELLLGTGEEPVGPPDGWFLQ